MENKKLKILIIILAFLLLIILILSSLLRVLQLESIQNPDNQFQGEAENFIDIQKCFSKLDSEKIKCLDDFVAAFAGDQSIKEILAAMESARNQDLNLENQCHPIAHAIGRLALKKHGTVGDAFESCDQSCHSGCYHGVMERLLYSEEEIANRTKHPSFVSLKKTIPTICAKDKFKDPNPAIIFNCLHGVGHAVLFSLDYDLNDALAACDLFETDYERTSCYGGVVMENITAFDKSKRDLKRGNNLYPCNALEDKYKPQCYLMQTSVMFEYGLTIDQIAQECGNAEGYVPTCFTSLGRDLSNNVRVGDIGSVITACEVASAEHSFACIQGTIYALIDNTWDGSFAYKFCSGLTKAENQNHCFQQSNSYLMWSYSQTYDQVIESCNKFADEKKDICIANIKV